MPDHEKALVVVREWMEKAENDFKNAAHTLKLGKECPTDTVCFHAQQCVEKYLKARLEEGGIAFAKTHDLPFLLTLATQIEPQWTVLQQQASALNAFAVVFRYPGQWATKARAKQAIADCREVRRVVRTAFGLPV